MDLVFITPQHPLYGAELDFRFRLLRAPLGMTRAQVLSPLEDTSLHLLALEDEVVVGCVLFHPERATGGRLFQMAVSAHARGTGMGRQLVQTLEAELTRRGVLNVHLHARETAVGFYERLGYLTFGEPFVEVGIPHRHMQRTLTV